MERWVGEEEELHHRGNYFAAFLNKLWGNGRESKGLFLFLMLGV